MSINQNNNKYIHKVLSPDGKEIIIEYGGDYGGRQLQRDEVGQWFLWTSYPLSNEELKPVSSVFAVSALRGRQTDLKQHIHSLQIQIDRAKQRLEKVEWHLANPDPHPSSES